MSAAEVSAQSECALCQKSGRKRIILRNHKMVHAVPVTRSTPARLLGMAPLRDESLRVIDEPPQFVPCLDYDAECRHITEPLGFYTVAFLPQRRRNGRWVWLRWIEQHDDGTVTLGNRAR